MEFRAGDELIVAVLNRRWMADDLAAGAAGRFAVRWDPGLDVPPFSSGRTAFWTPAEHAARLLAAGVRFDACAPGPRLLCQVPPRLLGREVWCGRFDELASAPAVGWFKVAEAKSDLAQGWMARDRFAQEPIPPASVVHAADRLLDITDEFRVVVAGGATVAVSAYRHGDSWFDPAWRPSDLDAAALRFASSVVDQLSVQPACWVLDVARLSSGRWAVVETNPLWCAGLYGCDLTVAAPAVFASSISGFDYGPFAWRPDALLAAAAAARPSLRRWLPPAERVGR